MRKQLLSIAASVLYALLITGCEETIELTLNNQQTHLVVEGGVFTKMSGSTLQQIRVSETVPFFDASNYRPVTDASVSVNDGTTTFIFLHTGDGVYQTSLAPEVGKMYTLNISRGANNYQASAVMPNVVEMQNVFIEYKDLTNDPFADGNKTGYVANYNLQDPAGIKNYYLNKLIVNSESTFFPDPGNRFNAIADDQFFDGELLQGLEVNNEYLSQVNDEIEVHLYNITKAQYDYYYTLFTITSSTALLGDSPPAVLRGNVQNLNARSEIVFGFFQVAGLDIKTITVSE